MIKTFLLQQRLSPLLQKNPRLPLILSDLLSKQKIKFPSEDLKGSIEETITIGKIENENNMNYSTILSYLYYTGCLTIGNMTETGLELKIPNKNAKKNYIHEISTIFNLLDISNKTLLDNAVKKMFEGNIGPLVEFIQSNSLCLLKHNDVIHSDESTLKAFFVIAIAISLGTASRKYVDNEHDIPGTQVDAFIAPPINMPDAPSVHIEFKNTTIGHINGWYKSSNWDFMN